MKLGIAATVEAMVVSMSTLLTKSTGNRLSEILEQVVFRSGQASPRSGYTG